MSFFNDFFARDFDDDTRILVKSKHDSGSYTGEFVVSHEKFNKLMDTRSGINKEMSAIVECYIIEGVRQALLIAKKLKDK